MAKKKTKEVKDVIPFQISNVKKDNVWFIRSGWKYYFRMLPIPFKHSKPDLRKFKN